MESVIAKLASKGVDLYLNDGKLRARAEKGVLVGELADLIRKHKQALVKHLSQEAGSQSTFEDYVATAPATAKDDLHELSFAQQQIWLIDQIEGGSPHYNMPAAFAYRGKLDLDLLQVAFEQLLARHEILRTIVVETEEGPKQTVLNEYAFKPACYEVAKAESDSTIDVFDIKSSAECEKIIHAFFSEPFELEKELKIRAACIALGAHEGVLLVNVHHIAADGVSIDILLGELSRIYAAALTGRTVELESVTARYLDFARWQRTKMSKGQLSGQRKYWLNRLKGVPASHSIPLDFPRSAATRRRGASWKSVVNQETVAALESLARSTGTTLFNILHAALVIVISRHSGNADVVIGTPVSGRSSSTLQNVVGCFINSLVLRTQCQNEPFSDFLRQLSKDNWEALQNQDYPFDTLVKDLGLHGNHLHSPVFQIFLALENKLELDLGEALDITQLEIAEPLVKYDIQIRVERSQAGMIVYWDYDSSIFKENRVVDFAKHYLTLLQNLDAHYNSPVYDIPFFDKHELDTLLQVAQGKPTKVPGELSVIDKFRQQAAATPDETASVYAEKQLSYSQLDTSSDKLAAAFKHSGVARGDLVAVHMPRSEDLLITLLAILKTGAAYVPLDPDYPLVRKQDIIEDADIRFLVADKPERAIDCCDKVITLCELKGSSFESEFTSLSVNAEDTAYVIFTSGSTGKPKGVVITHAALSNFLFGTIQHLDKVFNTRCRLLALTTISFDISVLELFAPLLVGGEVHIASSEDARTPERLAEAIESKKINVMQATPATWRLLVEYRWQGEKNLHALCGGEALALDLAQSLRPKVDTLWNCYGPTEATVWSMISAVEPGNDIEIGGTLPNYAHYVLDANGHIVPQGTVGELYIGGASLAKEYLNRSALNAERFVEINLSAGYADASTGNRPVETQRLYKTGDLVRSLGSDRFQYLGRSDNQIKVRGYRIEPGEIETVLEALQDVNKAVVSASSAANAETILVAYLELHRSSETQAEERISAIRNQVSKLLPGYMCPALYHLVDQWPLTLNGKIDRKKLPAIEALVTDSKQVPLEGAIQLELAALWSSLLSLPIDQIHAESRFFELGGHSLLVVKLTTKINSSFNVSISSAELFTCNVLQEQAALIEEKRGCGQLDALVRLQTNTYPLSESQYRLWSLHKINRGSAEYNMNRALKVVGRIDLQAVEQALTKLIERHECLRSCIRERDDEPEQLILETFEFAIEKSFLDDPNPQKLDAALATVFSKNFDLECELPIRAGYIGLHPDKLEHDRKEFAGVVYFSVHHMMADGWSINILAREFLELYKALSRGEDLYLSQLSRRFIDYVDWNKKRIDSSTQEKQANYWKIKLEGIPAVHSLPVTGKRGEGKTASAKLLSASLSSDAAAGFYAAARQFGLSPFMLSHAALALVVSRYSYADDVVIGTPVLNRNHPEADALVGFFVNTLALRVSTRHDTIASYLDALKSTHLEAQGNADISFDRIVDMHRNVQAVEHAPIFQIIFAERKSEFELNQPDDAGTFDFSPYHLPSSFIKFDIDIEVEFQGDALHIDWLYDTCLFDFKDAQNLFESFIALLKHLSHRDFSRLENREAALSTLEMLNPAYRQQALATALQTTTSAPEKSAQRIEERFAGVAACFPQRIAVQDKHTELSYAELEAGANHLAGELLTAGVAPGQYVAIALSRSCGTAMAMLAVLKAGCAYVPIDLSAPQDRNSYILENSSVQGLIHDGQLDTALNKYISASGIQSVYLNVEKLKVKASAPSTHQIIHQNSQAAAYVIYTSGSTGRPKGVLVGHDNLLALFDSTQSLMDFKDSDVWSVFHSFAFDFSVWELWGALLFGGKAVIIDYEQARSPDVFYDLVAETGVTILNQTPTAFYQFIEADNRLKKTLHLRKVIFGGEALSFKLLQAWIEKYGFDQPELINMYGITETTVHTTFHRISARDLQQANTVSNIGKPIRDWYIHLLSPDGSLAPENAVGEICVGGRGVAQAYLNNKTLTEERFIAHPWLVGQRLYKSGDLARLNPEGDLEYLGRIDNQVKIRGYRVELGEIENTLANLKDVSGAVVMLQGDDVVAYLAPADIAYKEQEHLQQIKQAYLHELKAKLPNYMVPRHIILLDNLPKTLNGKVDKSKLPAPEKSLLQSSKIMAASPQEKCASQIWQEVLGQNSVGVTDSFFALGGNSLNAIKVVSRMNRELNLNVQIKDIFKFDTIRSLLEYSRSPNDRVGIAEQLEQGRKKIADAMAGIAGDRHLAALLPADMEDIYPLSAIQKGMVFLSQLRSDEPIYHDQFSYLLDWDNFDSTIFDKAVTLVAQVHPMLRSSFNLLDFGQPVQIVHRESLVKIQYTDVSKCSKPERREQIKNYYEEDRQNKFLSPGDALWRIAVFKISQQQYCLILSVQHAALDGLSLHKLTHEIVDCYVSLARGEHPVLTHPASHYKDYVAIQEIQRASEENKQFWLDYLADYERSKLPFNQNGRPINNLGGMKVLTDELPPGLYKALKGVGEAHNCTLKEVLLAAHLLMLSSLTLDENIVTGVVTNDRPAIEDGDEILGCFLNTVPCKFAITSTWNIKALLQDVKSYLKNVKAHEIFLSDISSLISQEENGQNPLFDTIFNFTDFGAYSENIGSTIALADDLQGLTEISEMTNTLLDVEAHVINSSFIRLQLKYAPGYFYASEAAYALQVYKNILQEMAKHPEVLSKQDVINQQFIADIYSDFNATDFRYSSNTTLHALFEKRVQQCPDSIAVSDATTALTYLELDTRANELATLIQSSGLPKEACIGVMTDRSPFMVVAVLAVLKAACVYVPIEVDIPLSRKQDIANSAALQCLLVDEKDEGLDILQISADLRVHSPKRASNYECLNEARNSGLAYIIYTSGSTGKPKGVKITHSSAVNLVEWMNTRFDINAEDKMLCVTSLSFDLSVFDIFGLLAVGGQVVLAQKTEVHDPLKLQKIIEGESITLWNSVPATMANLIAGMSSNSATHANQALRLVLMSGDWIPVNLPKKIHQSYPQAEIISLGGATEATVWSNYYPINPVREYRNSIPYGKPIGNNTFYILDEQLNLQAPGVAGHLYIGGLGVAQGYMNDPEKTQAAFMADPFRSCHKGAMMYKTGDLGRMLPDGNMEFLGRSDQQIKIRGFRIELGEIESVLSGFTGVENAVVGVHKNRSEDCDNESGEYLVAYVITNGPSCDLNSLREQLKEQLPAYMVPALIVEIDEIPTNANGKVDRKALPEPDFNFAVASREFCAPQTETEKAMSDIWSDIFKVNEISTLTNFFDMGGHSLLAIRLISELRNQFAVDIPVTVIFENATIQALSAYIDEGKRVSAALQGVKATGDEEEEQWVI